MAENNGYWIYSGSSEVPVEPRIFTRCEKNQALTHLEMDFNLASLLHTAELSDASISVEPCTEKPTREEELAGLYVTLSYAPILNPNGEPEAQNDPVIVKVQHTTDEILYKISDEEVPGNLGISGSLYVSESARIKALSVEQSASIGGDFRVDKTASFDGDVYILGNLYVHGASYGNLSQPEYKSPNHAEPLEQFYTKEQVDDMIDQLRQELLGRIQQNSENNVEAC